jgi:uncharacterized protein (UPF0218 family)/phosphopantetheine adenylyltransferase
MNETWALNLFDRFHRGHRILLDRLVDMPNPVAGVADVTLMSKTLELSQIIQPLDLRKQRLSEYLRREDLCDTIKVSAVASYDELLRIPGNCTFLMFEGPCCAEIEEHALEVRGSMEGSRDEMIKLKPIRAMDGDKLSSARIRLGEIDREGRPLKGTSEHPRKLPDSNRGALQAPKGEVYSVKQGRPETRVIERIRAEKPTYVIAVGDVTSSSLIAAGYIPDVCVIDGITKRGEYKSEIQSEREYMIFNPPATIYPEAWSMMDTAIHDGKKSMIFVDGEEDLMGFPAVLLSEHGSVMLYGQPNVGMVWVPVNAENQKIAREFLEMMPLIV